MLIAFDADNVTKELWRSQGKDANVSDTKDSYGLLARFDPPMIANGKVFVATAGDVDRFSAMEDPALRPYRRIIIWRYLD